MRVTGVVQGVGFRPFVFGVARQLNLTGHVYNDEEGVVIQAQGSGSAIDALLAQIRHHAPPLAVVDDVAVTDLALAADTTFDILPSAAAEGTTSIPPDTAVCDECLSEMRDPADRRYGYPFIACTHCGPRYTIVTGLPYDREHTTMVDFPLCSACQREYDDPTSRRFHAQPTACPDCGPALSESVDTIVDALARGQVVALHGIGGYHLACDARNPRAVSLLRERKHRGDKPFAVMASTVTTAQGVVQLTPEAERVLTSPARPIVLAPSTDARVQASVAPGNNFLGVMLPYAPLHSLMFDAGAPPLLVMTSGNVADEPICTTPEEATERLGAMADLIVNHNRRIHVACDDSVVRAAEGAMQPVRRSRGYAPLPLRLRSESPDLVAVGGELKTTVCIASGHRAWLSQHIGDTANLETLVLLERTVSTLVSLERIRPESLVSDLHPGYLSRRWAGEEAARRGVAHLGVQHHHAHLASLLAEHQWPDDHPVLGLTFDGTGYSPDGTIWGGELLLGTAASVQRVGHLAPVQLPGGDAAIRRPLRSALSHLRAAQHPWDSDIPSVARAEGAELAVMARMVDTGVGCTPTTSMGRLFDAVASLLAIRHDVDYEGQAAIEMEALAASVPDSPATDVVDWIPMVTSHGGSTVINPAHVVNAAVASVRAGLPTAVAARRFHQGLAIAVARAAVMVRDLWGVDTVGLTGGVFSNGVLTAACRRTLVSEGFTVLVHERVPPNDGGLALGQVAVAAAGGAHVIAEMGLTGSSGPSEPTRGT